jgi:hypothetical protein
MEVLAICFHNDVHLTDYNALEEKLAISVFITGAILDIVRLST